MRKLMSTKMLLKHLKLFTTGESSWENPVKKKTTEATTTTTTTTVAVAVAARIYAISPCAQLRQQLPRLPRLSLSLSAVHLQCTLNAGAPVRYPLLPVRCTSMLK